MIIITNGGATNLKVGAQCTGRWGVNTVKTKTFEKGGWWVHDPPPAFMVAPPLITTPVGVVGGLCADLVEWTTLQTCFLF